MLYVKDPLIGQTFCFSLNFGAIAGTHLIAKLVSFENGMYRFKNVYTASFSQGNLMPINSDTLRLEMFVPINNISYLTALSQEDCNQYLLLTVDK
jgi:hypothetical protein